MHPTSLPSGKLDDDVLRWLDFMSEAGLSVWQVLPLVETDCWGSPYQSASAFAANTALLPGSGATGRDEIAEFRASQAHWIDDFALFRILGERFPNRPWWLWPTEYARRDPGALESLRRDTRDTIDRIVGAQYRFDLAWRDIRREAAARGIGLFGDMPIFVSHESADVWAHPELFLLDDDFQPRFVAGVPPDYFSETGQRWGNPHYDWERMQTDGFSWWCARLARYLEWFDLVRLDHFRALESVWMIEASCDTAEQGFWRETPGRELLAALRDSFGTLPLVAEDLGIITDAVRALRDDFALPGMAVLQFAFDGSGDNPHLPENIGENCVVYTGTHDNNTTVGWFAALDNATRAMVFDTFGSGSQDDIAWTMIEAALATAARLAVVPLQDFLRLDASARMNTPGVLGHNWCWKFALGDLEGLASDVRRAVEASGRRGNA